jgi:type II secretory pathway pseudopilin PulG
MWELASIVVLFLLTTGGVVALGRRTTARWERERARQAARARRRRAEVFRQRGSRLPSVRAHLPQRRPPTARRQRAGSAQDEHAGPAG